MWQTGPGMWSSKRSIPTQTCELHSQRLSAFSRAAVTQVICPFQLWSSWPPSSPPRVLSELKFFLIIMAYNHSWARTPWGVLVWIYSRSYCRRDCTRDCRRPCWRSWTQRSSCFAVCACSVGLVVPPASAACKSCVGVVATCASSKCKGCVGLVAQDL